MTASRIVVNAETSRAAHDMIVMLARIEWDRRKRNLWRLRITMTVALVLIGAALLAGAVALVMVVR